MAMSKEKGSVSYVPVVLVPLYDFATKQRSAAHDNNTDAGPLLPVHRAHAAAEAPAGFPPTFLYTQSWEDPQPDMQVLDINGTDTVLTLTSGGCNALNLLIHGAGHVVSVDCNPAQNALLELKAAAIRHLSCEDVWAMFGEGVHPHIQAMYQSKLRQRLTPASAAFWDTRLRYFRSGLYFHGGMGQVVYYAHILLTLMGMRKRVQQVLSAASLEEQTKIWDSLWIVRLFAHGPAWFVRAFTFILSVLMFNRVIMCGTPPKCMVQEADTIVCPPCGLPLDVMARTPHQLQLIKRDGVCICKYIARSFDGIARSSLVRNDNYFYYNCLAGRFARDNCPAFLEEQNCTYLREDALDRLEIVTGTFLDQLQSRPFTKVVLMDHMDWLDAPAAQTVAQALAQNVQPGGRIIWRSAALVPPYNQAIAAAGFQVQCLARADQQPFMDRVNMYASFYIGTRESSGLEKV